MASYGLAVTVHDPAERLLTRLSPILIELTSKYSAVAAVCTVSTSARTVEALKQAGFSPAFSVDGQIGESRRRAIRAALLNRQVMRVQYADLDRLVHWQYAFPDELRRILTANPTSDYIALGRTARALGTHPRVQILAETLTNAAFSAFLGTETIVDVVAGSYLISRRAAETIAKVSTELTNATDLEWPALVLRELRVMPEFWEVEGLEFETADYCEQEIRKAGSREKWMHNVFDSPNMWKQRTKLALDSIAALARVAGASGNGFDNG